MASGRRVNFYKEHIDIVEKLPNRRNIKNFFIRKDIQLRLALNNLFFLGVILAVLISVLLSPLYYDMQQADQLWTQYVSANFLWRLLDRCLLAFSLIVIFAIVYQFIFSHRLCGPLINFAKTYEKVIQGDLRRQVRLRRHDYLKPEAAHVNRMLDTISASILELKNNQQLLESAAAALQFGERFDRNTVDSLREALQKNKTCLQFWQIKE